MKLTAYIRSPGTAAPTAGPAAATGTTAVTSVSTGQPPKGGSHSAARALLIANRRPAGTSVSQVVSGRPRSASRTRTGYSDPGLRRSCWHSW